MSESVPNKSNPLSLAWVRGSSQQDKDGSRKRKRTSLRQTQLLPVRALTERPVQSLQQVSTSFDDAMPDLDFYEIEEESRLQNLKTSSQAAAPSSTQLPLTEARLCSTRTSKPGLAFYTQPEREQDGPSWTQEIPAQINKCLNKTLGPLDDENTYKAFYGMLSQMSVWTLERQKDQQGSLLNTLRSMSTKSDKDYQDLLKSLNTASSSKEAITNKDKETSVPEKAYELWQLLDTQEKNRQALITQLAAKIKDEIQQTDAIITEMSNIDLNTTTATSSSCNNTQEGPEIDHLDLSDLPEDNAQPLHSSIRKSLNSDPAGNSPSMFS